MSSEIPLSSVSSIPKLRVSKAGETVHDPDSSACAKLPGNSHHHDIGLGGVVNAIARDDRGSFLRGGLAGKREGHQHDIAELQGHRGVVVGVVPDF